MPQPSQTHSTKPSFLTSSNLILCFDFTSPSGSSSDSFMDKEKFFSLSDEANKIWNSSSFGMEMQSNELNCFYNPNWENSLDQSDPFESAFSSIVSSPVTSNANNVNSIPTGAPAGGKDTVMIRELIGRLGNICNSGDISPNSYINNNNNNSANTSCYSTPLNSPPKLNLSMVDSQIRGNLPTLGNSVSGHPSLAPFQTDPGFAERAARYSCFSGMNLGGGLNPQFGLNESEVPHRLVARDTGKLSRVSSNHSMKIGGSQQAKVQDKKKSSNFDKQVSSTSDNLEAGDSREESSVSEQITGGELGMKGQNESNARKRKVVPREKAKETPFSSPSASEAKVSSENDQTSSKRSKSNQENVSDKAKEEKNKENSKPLDPPKDYIHVRARRGQATDSHSLAERVRREKISERMKFLQDLVPGCNKVTGKAVMLDEIINYVQSLQRQVEFLSMKLATVNPRIDFNMEAVVPKDIFQSRGSMNQFPLDSTAQVFPCSYQSQQGLPLQNGVAGNADVTQFSMNQLNCVLRNPSLQYSSLDGLGDSARQVPSFWEDDLQSVVQMGFGHNQHQSVQRSIPTAEMKVEL